MQAVSRARITRRKSAMQAAAVATMALFVGVTPDGARAQDYFTGKTITLSTHSEVGGGYDVYLRLLARHMGKHIPGNPQLTVINQQGGGGLTAVNHAGNVAPQDGTFLTIVSQSVPVIEVTGGRG